MNPSVTPTACQLPLTREPCGQCPLTISHGGFLRIVLSLTRPVSAACPKPPLSKGGASACRGGGIPQAKPGNFLPITYSLFTKKLSLFHIGWYFEEVPTVNPSVTAAPCQLPLAREPFCARYRYCGAGLGIDNLQQVPPHLQTISLSPAGSLSHLR